MPESKSRKKPQSADRRPRASREPGPNPVWFKPVMFGLMLLGLVWILVFYITEALWPIPGIGAWNITIGFGIAIAGFLMTTRWRS
ncbi:cell division protein CrgA [Arthrobacter sp. H14]|uniref:cell division protein CrgA n=1 Tax=Arthrobacter sp. H14 TaxID=1312959 RepID=UPI00047ABBBE|nr:cell division protein CrgA [Arthrobacter sp. H14]